MARQPSPLDLLLHPDLGIVGSMPRGLLPKLTKLRLKRGVFRSLVDLRAAINRFIAETDLRQEAAGVKLRQNAGVLGVGDHPRLLRIGDRHPLHVGSDHVCDSRSVAGCTGQS
jgi:hypothetical protein